MFVIAYNKNLVSTPPTSFQDLADPKWKGKLAMEPTDADWFAAVEQYFMTQATPKMTQAQVDDMFKKIAANSQLIQGHTAEASALAAGQVSVVVTGHAQSIEQLQAKNAPVAFGRPFVTPIIQRPQGMGIPYLTPHPAAALLFYDFLLSPVGAEDAAAERRPAREPVFPGRLVQGGNLGEHLQDGHPADRRELGQPRTRSTRGSSSRKPLLCFGVREAGASRSLVFLCSRHEPRS